MESYLVVHFVLLWYNAVCKCVNCHGGCWHCGGNGADLVFMQILAMMLLDAGVHFFSYLFCYLEHKHRQCYKFNLVNCMNFLAANCHLNSHVCILIRIIITTIIIIITNMATRHT